MDLNFTQSLNLTDPVNTSNVYVVNQDLVILLLIVIAFCQVYQVIRILYFEMVSGAK